MLCSIFCHHQIPLHNRRRQQEFLFHAAKAYRDHIGLDGCYRANAKRLMLDLDTNLDFGNMVSSSSGQTRSSKSTSNDCIKYASSRVRSSGSLSASEEKGSGSLPSVLFHSVLFPRDFAASGCAESATPEPFFPRLRHRGSAKFLT